MVEAAAGVAERGLDVLALEIREVRKDLVRALAGGKKNPECRSADAETADARAPPRIARGSR
jgi:hypothetical protein